MTTLTIEMPRLHPGQREVYEHPARFRVLANGRRWGKTRLAIVVALEAALRGGTVWWVAPSYPMATVGWRGLVHLAPRWAHNAAGELVPVAGVEVRVGERRITMPGGGEVQVRSADNPDSLRGEGLDLVVLDEAAFMSETAWTAALRPALSDRQGRAVLISTPNGRNWFWRVFTYAASGEDPEWAAWSYPTSANPHIDPAEIEAARQQLPAQVFAQEYLAEFVDDAGLVFRNVEQCLWSPPAGPEPGRRYVAGVDWAQSQDWTVIVIMDDLGRVVHIERFNQIGWAIQRGRLAAAVERWGVHHVLAEANAMGGPNIEELQASGLPVAGFTTTSDSKSRLIQSLALAFERGDIAIPGDDALLAELRAFEANRLPSGRWQYAAPAGMHDDTVMALALAYWATAVPSGAGLVDFVHWG